MLMQSQQVEMCYMGKEDAKNAFKKTMDFIRTPAQVLLDYFDCFDSSYMDSSSYSSILTYCSTRAENTCLFAEMRNMHLSRGFFISFRQENEI